jgi:YHS domain-containing protein
MFKKTVIVLVTAAAVLGISGLSFAAMCDAAGHKEDSKVASAQNRSEAINVGNKICPVSDEKIDEKTKATYEYKGKVYNFCCPACIGDFKKNPEKYIKKIEAEKKGETGSHEHMH